MTAVPHKKAVFLMLGYFTPHKQYVRFVLTELAELAKTRPDQMREYQDAICKMLILDLDPLESVTAPLYPPIGKMADVQMEIYRSCVFMKHCEVPFNNWIGKLENNPVLRIIAGFTEYNMPKTSSYYDFINRIVPLDERPIIKAFKRKPAKKLGKNEKLPPKNPNITGKLADSIISDEQGVLRRLSRRGPQQTA